MLLFRCCFIHAVAFSDNIYLHFRYPNYRSLWPSRFISILLLLLLLLFSVLNFIASSLTCVKGSKLYVDLPGFVTPSVITGDELRPDLLLTIESELLYILELTVGFETNLKISSD